MKETLTEGLQRLLADWDEIIASHEGTADQRAGDEAKRPLFCDECYSRINRFAAGCWKGCAEQLRRTMAAHETSRQVSPGGAMTYTEMDDDTVNELNAEVARQRAEWQQPDPDGHLEESYTASAEEYLKHVAVCVRVYEALKRKEARARPVVTLVLGHPYSSPTRELKMRETCPGPMKPFCKLCGGDLDLALTCEFCQERGGA